MIESNVILVRTRLGLPPPDHLQWPLSILATFNVVHIAIFTTNLSSRLDSLTLVQVLVEFFNSFLLVFCGLTLHQRSCTLFLQLSFKS